MATKTATTTPPPAGAAGTTSAPASFVSPSPSPSPAPAEPCTIKALDDQSVLVTFRIEPQDWARLNRRIGPANPGTYLWENILYRAIQGFLY